MTAPTTAEPLVRVSGLTVDFTTDEGRVRAVEEVSWKLDAGRTLGIVGESGSGKSVGTRALVRLLPRNAHIAPESSILFRRRGGDLVDIARLDPRERLLREIRGGEIGLIFQEPMASFSPVYTIGNQMVEALLQHSHLDGAQGRLSPREARERAIEMLARVGIANPGLRVDQYPLELSGGMRQRAMIALALVTRPQLLIADEPTTALDVTIQAQILDLMKELQDEFGMAMVFITHDMGVIASVADEIAVMYLGRIVERGETRTLLREPRHPYTLGLLAALPRPEAGRRRLMPVPGDIPSPLERPAGCPFHTRCAQRIAGLCEVEVPPETDLGGGHRVSCFLYREGKA